MLTRLKAYFNRFDWLILASVMLLIAFSLVEIYSVALGQESVNLINFKKQLIFTALGLGLLFTFSTIDARFLKSASRYIYFLGIILLVLVLIFGSVSRGTRGWFDVAGLGIQPVEFVKIILIIFLANYFASLATRIKTVKHFILSGLSTLVFIGLVMLQPDFGSAVMLGAIWLIMLIAADFPKKYLISIILISTILFTFAWFFFFKPYQKLRIMTFIRPQESALESSWNVSQAIIAVGAGGLTGKGVGFGSQSQLKFLPEAQTDFIFAVLAEELGLLGVLLVLSFYSLFFYRCLRAIKTINNDFGIYFIIGSLGLIFIQMFINIGMNIGIIPVVGLPLPFVSYGGSSLLSLLIMVGIIENIIIKSKSRH